MQPYQIRGPMLAPMFGIADETGTYDETVLSTVNVRMDQLFRLTLRNCRSLVTLQRNELEKLVGVPGLETHELSVPLPEFNPSEEGIPEEYVRQINEAPDRLAVSADGRHPWVLIQTPMLRYKWQGRRVKSEVWTRIVFPEGTPKARKRTVKKKKKKAQAKPKPKTKWRKKKV